MKEAALSKAIQEFRNQIDKDDYANLGEKKGKYLTVPYRLKFIRDHFGERISIQTESHECADGMFRFKAKIYLDGQLISVGESKQNIKKDKGICEIANDNSIGQIIVSGTKESITELNNMLKEKKKRSIFLPVSAPFHCTLMKSAAENMKLFLQKTEFKDPSLQLVSNVTALPVEKDSDIKDLLYKQIFSQVRWRETVEYMIKNGINDFIEIGPGKVLSGLVKRTNAKVMTRSINKIDDIKNL